MLLDIKILPQPDDVTCGPTSLHAVYQYYGYHIELSQLIEETQTLENGGTLAVLLGIDAIRRGFKAKIYTYNLKVFDPTWADLSSEQLIEKLELQLKVKHKSSRFETASKAYSTFLKNGGKIVFEDLHSGILKRYFSRNIPILTGLSATYLYNSKREYNQGKKSIYDDIKGYPMGHF
ncbi:MAG: cysteine peptidase family C39 domain-containing protein, partial [Flammeovirgaceae bacterium]|nr:cysteine peptidase family C39 domain-containing protein [Flammeovirgaceae bacterium]MDW8287010.1 cysteine peptidase family C39 domain-containing protein [Flammeovirgaceae bacterium]